jgi:hypothetical protein
VALHGTDTRQKIVEALHLSEPSPALDRLNADHNWPLDTLTPLTPHGELAQGECRSDVHFRPGQGNAGLQSGRL